MSLAVLLGVLVGALLFGPLLLLWWIPDHRVRARPEQTRDQRTAGRAQTDA